MGKQFTSLSRPSLHCTGCVLHGYKEFFYCSDEDLKKDPNTQCEVINAVLEDLAGFSIDRGAPFPKNLFIQADNCPREMRNQFTLLWGVAMMLMVPHINSITYNFLRKGHTHEDIGTAITECMLVFLFSGTSCYLSC